MQISRILPLACAAAVFLSCFTVRADDNEAQLRARQALEQKMKELPPTAETPAPQSTSKKKKSKKETPPPAPKPTAAKPELAPEPVKPAPVAPVEAAKPSVPEVQPAPVVQTPAPVVPPPANSDAVAKAREAMRQKMSELPPEQKSAPVTTVNNPPPVASTNATVATAPKPTQPAIEEYRPAKPAVNNASSNGLAPLEAPASSLPASKEQRLQQLLQLYRADQITPQEYHDQRAKILSES